MRISDWSSDVCSSDLLFRLADAVRGVLHRLVQTSAPIELISAAADQLSEVVATLEQHPYGSIYEGFAESANAGEPFGFFHHSPMLGRAKPLAPPLLHTPPDHPPLRRPTHTHKRP